MPLYRIRGVETIQDISDIHTVKHRLCKQKTFLIHKGDRTVPPKGILDPVKFPKRQIIPVQSLPVQGQKSLGLARIRMQQGHQPLRIIHIAFDLGRNISKVILPRLKLLGCQ